ncbi:restriction endonuclease FokI C-terminal domain-containing protein [Kocuria varians]|uniref:Type-2 restriction enzyme StsI n=1 Tax=Kocuria varians TaxID=1272 RepID=A0A7D7KZN8_KOCVA|nr:restriction endonuclease FokI C-terminal domain-containing protein [Kocuria varians]QMS56029.1 Type-2 restriction enzyme StsI [Kocuria varians]
MRNTWWVTRPKRSLVSVPQCLFALANAAEGIPWKTSDKTIELEYERQLELGRLKAEGDRRDQGGGGARTYRAWMKSLGLVFMDGEDRMQLTCAGEAIISEAAPLPILKNQVLKYQFPSAFTQKGSSAVSDRFTVRPFVFLLQLLREPTLGGTLDEAEEVAKLVLTYGTDNTSATVTDVVNRILEHRTHGDTTLDPDYLATFASSRSKEQNLTELFKNLKDIANTMSNWLRYTQLITVERGQWSITDGAEDEVDAIIEQALKTPLIDHADDEVRFQRRYGLRPGQRKDTRRLGDGRSVTSSQIQEREVTMAFTGMAARQIITSITPEVIAAVAAKTGLPEADVERMLAKSFQHGALGMFIHEFAQMATESRKRATEFEQATASIFADVFGFQARHIGQAGAVERPDVVLASTSEHYGAILDSKAYASGYSARAGHRNTMRNYIERFADYALTEDPVAFFAYIVSDAKKTLNGQIKAIADQNGVPGSAITARDIIRMVERHQSGRPYTHQEIRDLLSNNRTLDYQDLNL